MKRSKPSLDKLLSQWAQDRAAGAQHLGELQDAVCSQAAHLGPANESPPPPGPRRPGRVALGLAAMLLIGGAIALLLNSPRIPEPERSLADSRPSATPTKTQPIEPSQLADKARLFEEVDELFGHGIVWIAETGDDLDVRPSDDPRSDAPAEPKSPPVMVRVTVMSRPPGAADWQIAWTVDVITRQEELVQWSPEQTAGVNLCFWTHLLDDGAIAIDSKLDMELPVRINSFYDGIQQPGIPETIVSQSTEDGDLRVLQTVLTLDDLG